MKGILEAKAFKPPFALTEEDLVRLWEGQRFPAQALMTADGSPVRVVFRGRPCSGPGPDFRDAVIGRGGQELRGDVELHVLTSVFHQHGHHRDHAYDNVILHVVFWDDEREDTLLASGRRAPVVALAPWVAQRAEELQAWLCRAAPWREPCRTAKERLGREGVAAILEAAGDRRFQEKAAAFAAALACQEEEEVLYAALLEALGYSQNREPFRLLAAALPWRRLHRCIEDRPAGERVLMAEAALLGRAGFLAGPWAEGKPLHPYRAELEERWRSWEGGSSLCLPWLWRGMRPENHPARRLAGAARLLVRYLGKGLLAGLMEAVAQAEEEGAPVLLKALTVGGDGFWLGHYDLESGSAPLPAALIGPGRAGEMAVNVVLPFALAWAEGRGDKGLARAAEGVYRSWPRLAPYGILRTLYSALGLPLGARRQQGMLHLFQRYCRQGGCARLADRQDRCPLS